MSKKKKVDDFKFLKEKLELHCVTTKRLELSLKQIDFTLDAQKFGSVDFEYWLKMSENNRSTLEKEYALFGWISARIIELEADHE